MKLPERKFIVFLFTIGCFFLLSYAQYDPYWNGADRAENAMEKNFQMRSDLSKVDSILDVHNHIRSNIERELPELQKAELDADQMDDDFNSKWSKVHYYLKNDEVVRIKTYGKGENNDRSEEFYLNNGELIMAVLEDHGSDSCGPAMKFEGKRFYFSQGEFVYASHINIDQLEEGDPSAEHLVNECQTYLNVLSSNKVDTEL